MKVLVVAEKPSAARDIAKSILKSGSKKGSFIVGKGTSGEDVTVAYARGHLLGLAMPQDYKEEYGKWQVESLPIVPVMPGWKFKNIPRDGTKALLKELVTVMKDHKDGEVINACDSGREGELIFRKVYSAALGSAKATKESRMWFSSMVTSALQKAYSGRHPLSKYDPLAESGYTRDEADWVVGMNYTVISTKTLPRGTGKWKVWSVGRVQTPTLALIVERDDIIENFVSQDYWEVFGSFGSGDGKSQLDVYHAKDADKLLGSPNIVDDRGKKVFWDKSKAEEFKSNCLSSDNYSVKDETKDRNVKAPLPFDLQEAQKYFNKWGITGANTLKLLQGLYEKKLISYPRTDSRYYNEDMKTTLPGELKKAVDGLMAIKEAEELGKHGLPDNKTITSSRVFNDKKVGEHYGLAPTGQTGALKDLNELELKVFREIVRACLISLDEDAIETVVTRLWEQDSGSGSYTPCVFKATAKTLKHAGWMKWRGKEETDEDVESKLSSLSSAMDTLKSIDVKEGKTTPPAYFNDATLLDAMKYVGRGGFEDSEGAEEEALKEVMKEKGIGTPATRTNIIDTLLARGYIEREKRLVKATDNGKKLIRELSKRSPELVSAKQTAEWELLLEKMSDGDSSAPTREQFLDALLKKFESNKDVFMKTAVSHAPVGKEITSVVCPRTSKPFMEYEKYFMAPGFTKLRMFKTSFGKKWTASDYLDLLNECLNNGGKKMDLKSIKTKKTYNALVKLKADESGFELEFEKNENKTGTDSGEICPESGKAIEDFGGYYSFPGFKAKFWKKQFGKEFTLSELIEVAQSNLDGDPKSWKLYSEKKKKNYEAKILIGTADDKFSLGF